MDSETTATQPASENSAARGNDAQDVGGDAPAAPRVLYVLDEHMDACRKQIAAWQRKAAKLAAFPLSIVVGEKTTVKVDLTWEVEGTYGKDWRSKTVKRAAWPVEIIGEVPVLNGWSFAAALVPLSTANVINSTGDVAVPGRFRDTGTACEHCGSKRRRSETFVVHNASEGRFMQVGRSCLKDFLPGKDAEAVLSLLEGLRTLRLAGEEREPSGGGSAWRWEVDTLDYLGHVAQSIRLKGYVSRAAARDDMSEEVVSTATLALNAMMARNSRDARVRAAYEAPTDADEDMAARAIAHWQGCTPRGELEYDLRTIAREEVILTKLTGKAAYCVEGYRRTLEAAAAVKKAAQAPSAHVGTVGQRIELMVTVTRVRAIQDDDDRVVYGMRDDAGNDLVWFSTGGQLAEGQRYKLRATVRAHNEFRGAKETVVVRATVLEDVDGPRLAAEREARAAKRAEAQRAKDAAVEAHWAKMRAENEAKMAAAQAARAEHENVVTDAYLAQIEIGTGAIMLRDNQTGAYCKVTGKDASTRTVDLTGPDGVSFKRRVRVNPDNGRVILVDAPAPMEQSQVDALVERVMTLASEWFDRAQVGHAVLDTVSGHPCIIVAKTHDRKVVLASDPTLVPAAERIQAIRHVCVSPDTGDVLTGVVRP